MSDDFFAELEAEIATATVRSKLKTSAVKLKRDAMNTRLSARARKQASDEYKAIQDIVEENQWKTRGFYAMFTEQACDGCSSVHHTFLQYMREEWLERKPSTKRWVRAGSPYGVILGTIIQPLKTHICSYCCEEHGFNIATPSMKLMAHNSMLTVSNSYSQEDINASFEEN